MRLSILGLAFSIVTTFALSATAEQITAEGKGRSCEDYFVGQMHLKGPIAKAHAEQFAKENAKYRLEQACKKALGSLTQVDETATCGKPEDQGMRRGPFTHSVCVSCEATATGDCT